MPAVKKVIPCKSYAYNFVDYLSLTTLPVLQLSLHEGYPRYIKRQQ